MSLMLRISSALSSTLFSPLRVTPPIILTFSSGGCAMKSNGARVVAATLKSHRMRRFSTVLRNRFFMIKRFAAAKKPAVAGTGLNMSIGCTTGMPSTHSRL